MAQLRQDYAKFRALNAEIIVLGPDGPNAFKRNWQAEQFPFTGLADIRSRVSDLYYQEFNLLKLGRMPALFVIDLEGKIRYAHYADDMTDIPSSEEVLAVLANL